MSDYWLADQHSNIAWTFVKLIVTSLYKLYPKWFGYFFQWYTVKKIISFYNVMIHVDFVTLPNLLWILEVLNCTDCVNLYWRGKNVKTYESSYDKICQFILVDNCIFPLFYLIYTKARYLHFDICSLPLVLVIIV